MQLGFELHGPLIHYYFSINIYLLIFNWLNLQRADIESKVTCIFSTGGGDLQFTVFHINYVVIVAMTHLYSEFRFVCVCVDLQNFFILDKSPIHPSIFSYSMASLFTLNPIFQ